MKVSVVVPVYNPGAAIERCIDSLRRQTMPAEDVEVVFVDDGCTDDTPALLDRLAEQEPNMRVIHEENSGWAGKPRNVGVDAARGDYVQFLDQDDMLGRDALHRLHAMGARNRSDIVLGKVVSDFRGVPHVVFRDNVERCTVRDFPLVSSLTPHKMFRRAFLLDHGLRFPEGRRRLEDQLFMMKSYLAADVVSIVGDYPCYYYLRREDKGNAGSTWIEPKSYYANLREVLDVVVAGTDPGELRNDLLRRFYRTELLRRLSEPVMLRWPEDYRRRLFAEIREVVRERFDDEVAAGLPPLTRARAALVQADRLDAMVDLARRCAQIQAVAKVRAATWVEGRLQLDLRVLLRFAGGEPLLVDPAAGRLADPDLAAAVGDGNPIAADLDRASADVYVRDRATKLRWFAPADLTVRLQPVDGGGHRIVAAGTATLDPARLAGGRRLRRGTWDVVVSLSAFGITRPTRLRVPAGVDLPAPTVVGRRPVLVTPRVTRRRVLELDVTDADRRGSPRRGRGRSAAQGSPPRRAARRRSGSGPT